MINIMTFLFLIAVYVSVLYMNYRRIRIEAKYFMDKDELSKWENLFEAYFDVGLLDLRDVITYQNQIESDYVKCKIILSYSNIVFWVGLLWAVIDFFGFTIYGIILIYTDQMWSWETLDIHGVMALVISLFVASPFLVFIMVSKRKLFETVQFDHFKRFLTQKIHIDNGVVVNIDNPPKKEDLEKHRYAFKCKYR